MHALIPRISSSLLGGDWERASSSCRFGDMLKKSFMPASPRFAHRTKGISVKIDRLEYLFAASGTLCVVHTGREMIGLHLNGTLSKKMRMRRGQIAKIRLFNLKSLHRHEQ